MHIYIQYKYIYSVYMYTCLNVYVHNIRLFFFVVSALLICSYATECPGLETGFGILCSRLHFAAGTWLVLGQAAAVQCSLPRGFLRAC